ncbi:MAG: DUF4340 domain-containing protein [Acidimicrobiia bacterium]|nr:DUF4340 domain-containing protein [Acidimicrobiia bacterium]
MKGVVFALLLTLAACGRGTSRSTSDKVPVVVPGASSTWTTVTVRSPASSADLPADMRSKLTPLLASRLLARPAPLSEYGLDRPQAALTYTNSTGSTAEVDIGQPNFDRHFVYAQRRGRPGVYLLPADNLRPVLALVGIDVQPPD